MEADIASNALLAASLPGPLGVENEEVGMQRWEATEITSLAWGMSFLKAVGEELNHHSEL